MSTVSPWTSRWRRVPRYGNDDDRVDQIAVEINQYFMEALRRHPAYRGAEHTLSLLTITSNVVYGQKTGATPMDARRASPLPRG